jgi:hypothetical protein
MNNQELKDEIAEYLSTSKLDERPIVIIGFFAMIRTYIESCNLQEKYHILWFYCNWNLHPNLDSLKKKIWEKTKVKSTSHSIFWIIRQALMQYYPDKNKFGEEKSMQNFCQSITNAMSFHTCIIDLNKFITDEIKISPYVFPKSFYWSLWYVLKDREIAFSELIAGINDLGIFWEENSWKCEVYVSKLKLVTRDWNKWFLEIYVTPPPAKQNPECPWYICQINDYPK